MQSSCWSFCCFENLDDYGLNTATIAMLGGLTLLSVLSPSLLHQELLDFGRLDCSDGREPTGLGLWIN